MNAFFFGFIAESCRSLKKGDLVIFTNVVIERSPSPIGHKFQLVVNREWSDVSVWMISSRARKKRGHQDTLAKEGQENCEAPLKVATMSNSEDGDVKDTPKNEDTSSRAKSTTRKSWQKEKTHANQRRLQKPQLLPKVNSPSSGETSEVHNVVSANEGTSVLCSSTSATVDKGTVGYNREKQVSQSKSASQGPPLSTRQYRLADFVVCLGKNDISKQSFAAAAANQEMSVDAETLSQASCPHSNPNNQLSTKDVPSTSTHCDDDVGAMSQEMTAEEVDDSPTLFSETCEDSQQSTETIPGTPSGQFSPVTRRRSLDTHGANSSPEKTKTSGKCCCY